MALTEIYVDPSIAADSGTGTIGDPFGDLEYAIEQTTFDTTNGTRLNVKAGTDDFLSKPVNKVELLKRIDNMLKLKDVTDEVERLRLYIDRMESDPGPGA